MAVMAIKGKTNGPSGRAWAVYVNISLDIAVDHIWRLCHASSRMLMQRRTRTLVGLCTGLDHEHSESTGLNSAGGAGYEAVTENGRRFGQGRAASLRAQKG